MLLIPTLGKLRRREKAFSIVFPPYRSLTSFHMLPVTHARWLHLIQAICAGIIASNPGRPRGLGNILLQIATHEKFFFVFLGVFLVLKKKVINSQIGRLVSQVRSVTNGNFSNNWQSKVSLCKHWFCYDPTKIRKRCYI